MSTIKIEVTKNFYDVDLQQNVTSYDVTLEKGYYPLPGGGGGDLSNYVTLNTTQTINSAKSFVGNTSIQSRLAVKDTSGTDFFVINADTYRGVLKNPDNPGNEAKLFAWNKTSVHGNNILSFQLGTPTALVRVRTNINEYVDSALAVIGNSYLQTISTETHGTSANWKQAYDDKINSVTFTSSTLTLTQQDSGVVSVLVPTFNQNTTGNAGTATKLQTARTINGVSFDGSADITINAVDSIARIASSEKGAINGVATLDSTGKVPATQLPSYVDDVLEFANLASFPATGESGKIYIAIDTNLTYRWGGSSYVVMSSSLALGETSSTAYRGDRGKIAYDHSQTTGNPHGTTKSDIGLGNVPNIDATNPTNIVQTSSYRFVTDSEKTNLSTAYTHSQATGNPHNTKVEELTDVSGDATTIIDDDIILKKEVGGLWKKITFANFKNWFTTELAKKINIGLDTVFNFKNISAMTLTEFRGITPNIETIYFTEEQNATGWQQVRHKSNYSIGYQALVESVVNLNVESVLESDSDSSFNLIDVANTKINGIFENDFMIITFSAKVETPSTPNQWFKLILRINGVQVAVSPVFYLLEPAEMPERISHSFALNVTPEMVTYGATLYIKPSVNNLIFNSQSLTVARVHKSTNANL